MPRALSTASIAPIYFFEVLPAPDSKTKLSRVRDFLRSPAAEGAGLIYAGTRRETEEVSAFVREIVGLPVKHYHAGLDPATRAEVQDSFLSGDLPLVVATNAFGMGDDPARQSQRAAFRGDRL